ncbi:hypothetical protein BHE74_00005898 [Ensete ventricosum]|nr:hypothetical protein BHE74_00005898 [Ensete ventricosum]
MKQELGRRLLQDPISLLAFDGCSDRERPQAYRPQSLKKNRKGDRDQPLKQEEEKLRLPWKRASVLPPRGGRSQGGRVAEEAREGEGGLVVDPGEKEEANERCDLRLWQKEPRLLCFCHTVEGYVGDAEGSRAIEDKGRPTTTGQEIATMTLSYSSRMGCGKRGSSSNATVCG